MSDTYRVLVTGSRDWEDQATVEHALDDLLARHGTLTLVHGAARKGADSMAHNWGLNRRHASSYGAVTIEPYPADWDRYGRAAGLRRNAEMVALGADVVLAFIKDGSRGASHCAGLAEKAGIPVRRFRA
jgi:YspA, cpYpsA-related SLOG family